MTYDATAIVTEQPPTARAERGEQKYAQVLAGARAVFLADGFEGASVDDIARTAGISKATLYRHFPDKAALFGAVARQECQRHAALCPDIGHCGGPLDEFLFEVAQAHSTFVLGAAGQGMYRIAVAESERFPEIGQNFYAAGPERGCKLLAPMLAAAADRGELTMACPEHAAHVFFAICTADIFHKRLFSIGAAPTARDIAAQARASVEIFLRAYQYAPSRTDAASAA